MTEQVKDYVELQKKINEVVEETKRIKKEADSKIKAIKEEKGLSSLEGDLEALKLSIEKSVLEQYEETGNKVTKFGIKVQETNTFDYDKSKALQYAKDHNLFLALDKKSFESFAKSTEEELDFVTKGKGTRVTWPKEITIPE